MRNLYEMKAKLANNFKKKESNIKILKDKNKENNINRHIEKRLSISKEPKEILKTKSMHQITINLKDNIIDKKNQIPHDYLTDIYINLQKEEKVFIYKDFIKYQTDINDKMRAFVVDWLIDIHFRFKLRHETLFIAINIMDNYLAVKNFNKCSLQLLAVASFIIACKYEEIFCPEIKDFVFLMDYKYEIRDVTRMETDILKVLKFNVTQPTTLHFFQILVVRFNFNDFETKFGYFLLEMFCLDSKCREYMLSDISMSIAYIITRIYYPDKANGVKKMMPDDAVLINCVLDICFLFDNIVESEYRALLKKYPIDKYAEIANVAFC
jgi:hypothetical protein